MGRPVEPPTTAPGEDLEWRLRNLGRGATSFMTLEQGNPEHDVERAAFEAIAAADDERASIEDRLSAREDLLASMGRLDRALRHAEAMEAAHRRWSEPGWGRS